MLSSYRHILINLWGHLSPTRRKQFIFLLSLSGVSAFTDMVSLGIVFPFFAALVSPDKVLAMPHVSNVVGFIGIETADGLIMLLTATLIAVTLLSAGLKLALLRATAQVSFLAAGDLNVEIFKRTLYQPYSVHIARNSSEIIAGINAKVTHATMFLQQTVTLFSALITLIAVTIVLTQISTLTFFIAIIIFAAAYFLISRIVKKRLKDNGQALSVQIPRAYKALQEGLGGIRDVLLDGSQDYYCASYAESNDKIRRAQASNSFLNTSPRHLMEGVAIMLLVMIACYLTLFSEDNASVLPILGTLAIGAQRALPNMQIIYSAWANVMSSEPMVRDAMELLDQPLPNDLNQQVMSKLPFENLIELNSVDFRYKESGPLVLRNLSLKIEKGSRTGIVGTTGSGKSTLLDILMGLIKPSQGALLIDGVELSERDLVQWRSQVSHVPQNVFLLDATIAENIALGVDLENIDMLRVKEVAHQARIADFIESREEGYFTQIGERGARLSGGQRQRLAIARALFKRASVLVLDEATSALDNQTETEIVEEIKHLKGDKTIIVIAHRLTTVRHCHRIYRLEKGEIVQVGNPNVMLSANA